MADVSPHNTAICLMDNSINSQETSYRITITSSCCHGSVEIQRAAYNDPAVDYCHLACATGILSHVLFYSEVLESGVSPVVSLA